MALTVLVVPNSLESEGQNRVPRLEVVHEARARLPRQLEYLPEVRSQKKHFCFSNAISDFWSAPRKITLKLPLLHPQCCVSLQERAEPGPRSRDRRRGTLQTANLARMK